jgi:uncharacterized DUF497 family protein
VLTVVFGDFEWDDDEADANRDKHGVSFEEAASVFLDVDYLLISDAVHEDRFIALGFSQLARLLVVVHVERGERIRIISARRATRPETMTHERRKDG